MLLTSNSIIVWNILNGKKIVELLGHLKDISALVFNPDGKTLISGSCDATIKIWNIEKGVQIRELKGHLSDIRSLALRPDGKTLISGGADSKIKIWTEY